MDFGTKDFWLVRIGGRTDFIKNHITGVDERCAVAGDLSGLTVASVKAIAESFGRITDYTATGMFGHKQRCDGVQVDRSGKVGLVGLTSKEAAERMKGALDGKTLGFTSTRPCRVTMHYGGELEAWA